MEIRISSERGKVPVTVMHVTGNIDSGTYESFLARAEEAMKNGARHILVDLEQAPFVSSAGLRALNSIFNRLRELSPDVSDEEMRKGLKDGSYKSSHLKLLKPSEASLLTLQNSGFSMFLQIFTDFKTALASY
jgi:anti-anti-sigma factor